MTTGAVFGMLALVHVWRAIVEGPALAKNPFYLAITIAAAALCFWACRLVRQMSRQ